MYTSLCVDRLTDKEIDKKKKQEEYVSKGRLTMRKREIEK